jgi:hypothetical protein
MVLLLGVQIIGGFSPLKSNPVPMNGTTFRVPARAIIRSKLRQKRALQILLSVARQISSDKDRKKQVHENASTMRQLTSLAVNKSHDFKDGLSIESVVVRPSVPVSESLFPAPSTLSKVPAKLRSFIRAQFQTSSLVKYKLRKFIGLGTLSLEGLHLNVTEIETAGIVPVLVFVNRKSGGKMGSEMIESFSKILHEVQICDLSHRKPSEHLALFKGLSERTPLILLCCGGDGTVGWVLQELDMLGIKNVFIGIIPLGTGNDLYGTVFRCGTLVSIARPAQFKAKGAQVVTDEAMADPQNLLLDYCPSRSSMVTEHNHAPDSDYIAQPDGSASTAAIASDSDPKTIEVDRWSIEFVRRTDSLKAPMERLRKSKTGEVGMLSPTATGTTTANGAEPSSDAQMEKGNLGAKSDTAASSIVSSNAVMASGPTQGGNRMDEEAYSSRSGTNSLQSGDGFKPSTTRLSRIRNFVNVDRKRSTIKTMNNYMGIGVDGAISFMFAEMRRLYPGLFFSAIINKIWYGLLGLITFLIGNHKDLSRCVVLRCDGRDIKIPRGTQGIIVSNINSYAGGVKLWRKRFTTRFKPVPLTESPRGEGAVLGERGDGSERRDMWLPSSMNDRQLEVVAVNSVYHLGQIRAGLSEAKPIAQGSHIEFVCDATLPFQVDGEPWIQRPCNVQLNWSDAVRFLVPLKAKQSQSREELP